VAFIRPLAVRAVVLCAFLLLAHSSLSADSPKYESAGVTTLAGNGLPGIVDGPAHDAEFLLPSGVAVRRSDGAVFISDEAGQRIRELTPSGKVLTIAGSGSLIPPGLAVAGGYADGPASQARFNRPAGLAVGPDGGLYIADSLNGCIRRLLNNMVTTVVGKCYGMQGPTIRPAIDGNVETARFINPRGLAFDSSGNLYIADVGGGLRRFSRDGILSTIVLKNSPDNKITSVAYGAGADPVVLATSPTSVGPYHPSTGKDDVISHYESEGLRPFGEPNGLAAIDARQFLFTDANAEVIRYLRLPAPPYVGTTYTRVIAGNLTAGAAEDAGYRDGPLSRAEFNAPMGIAVDGRVAYVADAGNRRIRKIVLPPLRVSEVGLSPSHAVDNDHYEIALVGASYVFYDTLGDDSICAHLENALNESHRFSKPVRCHTIRIDAASLPVMASYIESVLPAERLDAVIMYLSAWQAPMEDGTRYFYTVPPSEGSVAVKATVRKILASLSAHTSLAIAWGYLGSDVSDSEDIVVRQRPTDFYPESKTFDLPDEGAHRIITQYVAALRDLPILQYDLYDDLVRYEKDVDPLPLYEPADLHFSPRGHAFLGLHIAAGLLAEGLGKKR